MQKIFSIVPSNKSDSVRLFEKQSNKIQKSN